MQNSIEASNDKINLRYFRFYEVRTKRGNTMTLISKHINCKIPSQRKIWFVLFIKTKGERGKFVLVFSDPSNMKNIVTIYQKTKY